jgi:hypothetical protein
MALKLNETLNKTKEKNHDTFDILALREEISLLNDPELLKLKEKMNNNNIEFSLYNIYIELL